MSDVLFNLSGNYKSKQLGFWDLQLCRHVVLWRGKHKSVLHQTNQTCLALYDPTLTKYFR